METMDRKTDAPGRRPWWKILYVQVLIAIAIGVTVGALYPETGTR